MEHLINCCWTCKSEDLKFTPNNAHCNTCGRDWNPIQPMEWNPNKHTLGQKATRRAIRELNSRTKINARYLGQSGSVKEVTQGSPTKE